MLGEMSITGMNDLAEWNATIEQVRDACLESRLMALNMPGEAGITEDEIELLAPMAQEAVRAGRLIECGHLPNEIIKLCGKRGGLMYTAGLLGHPFTDPWILYHTWEEGTAVYVIDLRETEHPAGGYDGDYRTHSHRRARYQDPGCGGSRNIFVGRIRWGTIRRLCQAMLLARWFGRQGDR